jgi:hypothetical protein
MSKKEKPNYVAASIMLVVLFLILTSCLFGGDSEGGSSVSVPSEPNWSLYTPELKGRILNSDCTELQKEFNIAADNSDRQRKRTGSGNVELMNFIDARLKAKGCY